MVYSNLPIEKKKLLVALVQKLATFSSINRNLDKKTIHLLVILNTPSQFFDGGCSINS